jgi:hypothetical protein
MEIKRHPILKRFFTSKDFCQKYVARNIRWKIISCDGTFTVPQLLFSNLPYLKIIELRPRKNVHIISIAIVQKKLDLMKLLTDA